LLLAGWIGLLGDDAAHYLNLTLFIVLLCVLIGVQWRLVRSRWRALAGTVPIVVLPTSVYLWALTPTREIAAHLFAFTGLFVLLGAGGRGLTARRTAIGGVARRWRGGLPVAGLARRRLVGCPGRRPPAGEPAPHIAGQPDVPHRSVHAATPRGGAVGCRRGVHDAPARLRHGGPLCDRRDL